MTNEIERKFFVKEMERLKLKVAVFIILIREDKILLSRRLNTGWQDGNYGLPSGHLEANETLIEAMERETEEETGIKLDPNDIRFVQTMHYKSIYIHFYFTAKSWTGEPQNMEPDKCDDLDWFPLTALPQNIVPHVKFAIENYQKGILFSEFESEE